MANDPDPAVAARLRSAFGAQEQILGAALAKARADFDHRGVKGDAVEEAVRAFLRAHLPRRYDVGKGEVIDRFGHRTSQLDVIVLNDEQPFVHPEGTSGVYLAEGVSAVGEVKTRLDKTALDDILSKGERIRQLRLSYSKGDQIYTNESDRKRFISSLPYFAVAMEAHMSGDAILAQLMAADDADSPEDAGVKLPKLDALFILGLGTVINFGDGQGSFRFIRSDGELVPGWIPFPEDDVLVTMFTWLHAVMPRVLRHNSIGVQYLIGDGTAPEGAV